MKKRNFERLGSFEQTVLLCGTSQFGLGSGGGLLPNVVGYQLMLCSSVSGTTSSRI